MKKEAKTGRKKEDNPAARLAMVLLRYARGWWEQRKLAAARYLYRAQSDPELAFEAGTA